MFSYAEIYSLQRGKQFQGLLQQARETYEALRISIAQQHPPEPTEMCRLQDLHAFLYKTQYLFMPDGSLHPSARLIQRFSADTPEMRRLRDIMRMPARRIDYTLCEPVYRDAILFYNAKGEIISALNICFECSKMKAIPGKSVKAGRAVYAELAQFIDDIWEASLTEQEMEDLETILPY